LSQTSTVQRLLKNIYSNIKMKLIVTGATGFVGTEVIRQALRNPAVTSVIALARKPVLPPENAGTDTSKLQAIVLEDWSSPYPESVKEHIKYADACIWFVNPAPYS
jgi:nucleoside-diphosphate-sugar epimerase